MYNPDSNSVLIKRTYVGWSRDHMSNNAIWSAAYQVKPDLNYCWLPLQRPQTIRVWAVGWKYIVITKYVFIKKIKTFFTADSSTLVFPRRSRLYVRSFVCSSKRAKSHTPLGKMQTSYREVVQRTRPANSSNI